MGSADESETFYDSLEEEVEQFRSSPPQGVSGPCFQTPPNTCRFLNCFDNLDARTTMRTSRKLTVSPATNVEDMDHLATAFQNLSLEDTPRARPPHGHSTRRNVRRSKSCTSLAGKNTNATKKKTASTSKLRIESVTNFKSKGNSYLEMYQKRKNIKGHKHDARRRPGQDKGDDIFQKLEELDLAPPPTTRSSYDSFSCSSSVHDFDNTTYQNVGDFRAFPADVDQYMSINLNTDGIEWRPKNVAQRSDPGGRPKHHSYVPYSIKDYKSLQVPKLGSLGYDREAVRDKYEKMKRQRAYGMQASVRNRSKITVAQKSGVDQMAAVKPAVPDKKQQQQGKGVRKHAQMSRTKTVVKKPQGERQGCDLQPLVERHLKEMQASAIIRQNFMCL